MNERAGMETTMQPVAVLRGVPWYPHYQFKDLYVGPTGKQLTKSALTAFGATWTVEALWPRA